MQSIIKFLFPLIWFTILSVNSFEANAQLSKGTITIGGTINGDFNSNKDVRFYGNSNTEYGIQLTPALGYILSEHIELFSGVGIGVTKTATSNFNSNGTNLYYYLSLIPGINYYFLPSDSKINYFLQSSISIRYGHWKSTSTIVSAQSNDEETTLDLVTTISPGVIYFMNTKIGIYSTLGFIQYHFSDRENYQFSNSLTVNLNLASLNVGLKYFINKNK